MTLTDYRKQRGLTLQQVADKLNVSVGYISHLETGRTTLSKEMPKRLATAYGIPSSKVESFANDIFLESAWSKSWISKIEINGLRLEEAFRFNQGRGHVASRLAEFISSNIRQAVVNELKKNPDLIEFLEANIK
jgi:transcriptional regulator with XRE-family HTH domain